MHTVCVYKSVLCMPWAHKEVRRHWSFLYCYSPYILRQGLSLNMKFAVLARLAGQGAPGICLCVCVHGCVCTSVQVHTPVGIQRPEKDIGYPDLSSSTHCFETGFLVSFCHCDETLLPKINLWSKGFIQFTLRQHCSLREIRPGSQTTLFTRCGNLNSDPQACRASTFACCAISQQL